MRLVVLYRPSLLLHPYPHFLSCQHDYPSAPRPVSAQSRLHPSSYPFHSPSSPSLLSYQLQKTAQYATCSVTLRAPPWAPVPCSASTQEGAASSFARVSLSNPHLALVLFVLVRAVVRVEYVRVIVVDAPVGVRFHQHRQLLLASRLSPLFQSHSPDPSQNPRQSPNRATHSVSPAHTPASSSHLSHSSRFRIQKKEMRPTDVPPEPTQTQTQKT